MPQSKTKKRQTPATPSPASDDAPVRSEAQRLLIALDVSGADLAEQLGCSRQAVHLWRSGEKRPGKPTRTKLEELHQIPESAWFEAPSAAEAPEPPVAVPSLPPLGGPNSRDELREVEELIAEVRLIRASGKLMPRERDQNIRTESDLLRRRGEIEERSERARIFDRKIEHEIATTVFEVLKRYPSAEAEVLGALRALKRTAA